jgi:serine/threonine protein kinase
MALFYGRAGRLRAKNGGFRPVQMLEAKGGKGPPLPQALHYGVQVTRGLASLHDQNVVVLDLKPANLLFDEHDLHYDVHYELTPLPTLWLGCGQNDSTFSFTVTVHLQLSYSHTVTATPDEKALKFPRPPPHFLHEPRLFLDQFCVLSFARHIC